MYVSCESIKQRNDYYKSLSKYSKEWKRGMLRRGTQPPGALELFYFLIWKMMHVCLPHNSSLYYTFMFYGLYVH